MNGTFRQSMSWLHTWAGLSLGWALYFIFITGTAGYFDNEIDQWMQPEIPLVEESSTTQAQMLQMSERFIQEYYPKTAEWYINFPSERYPYLGIGHSEEGQETQVDFLSPQTGQLLSLDKPRETGGGQLLYRMHYELHYMPHDLADWLVSISTMFMFVALVCGVVIHKKIFKEFFTFRPHKGQRSWLDMHNIFSVLSLPFQLMITYSGLIFLMSSTMPAIENIASHEAHEVMPMSTAVSTNRSQVVSGQVKPLSEIFLQGEQYWGKGNLLWMEVDEPSEQNAVVTIASSIVGKGVSEGGRITYDRRTGEFIGGLGIGAKGAVEIASETLMGLHVGLFAGPFLRWLYFISGLVGAGMVATGLILWATKRRKTAEKSGVPHRGLVLVECLNVGTVVGLPIAIAAYFWANRLLPVELVARADKEVLILFIVWGLSLVYPVFRPVQRAWSEFLWVAAALYALLPVLNFLTSDRHLGFSVLNGDWVMIGFDLTVLALGLGFGVAALKVQKQSSNKSIGDNEPNMTVNVEGVAT